MVLDRPSARTRYIALFVGAHPDDIELGAGATAALLTKRGWTVWFLILTSEDDKTVTKLRKSEAAEAAAEMGLNAQQIIFAGFPDTRLVCNGSNVRAARQLLNEADIDPDVIFTHTHADSHRDHREARSIALAIFRRRPILGFAVVNSLIRSASRETDFEPRIFIDVNTVFGAKLSALARHRSQRSRIDMGRVSHLCHEYGQIIGSSYGEAFDLIIQDGTADIRIELIAGLNDSPFHSFWLQLLGSRSLTIVHAVPVWRRSRTYRWSADGDRLAVSSLYKAFNEFWQGRVPLEDRSCEDSDVDEFLESGDILLSGGPASNAISRNYFNFFPDLRYVLEYAMPGYRDMRIFDRINYVKIKATYGSLEAARTQTVTSDTGILTIMPNPMAPGRSLVGCMGIHRYGSLACFRCLSEQTLLGEISQLVSFPLDGVGYQLLIDYDVVRQRTSIRHESVYSFECREI
jgi:LmbE family N-acetylglucosaminyl deacetylase